MLLAPLVLASSIVAGPSGPDVCPLVLGIAQDGTYFTNRFAGWYKTSLKLLESDLRGGCYNDSHPSPVTSVTVEISKQAPRPRVDAAYNFLSKNGWSKEKIAVKPWTDRNRLHR